MSNSGFFLEFELNIGEIRKLNKMYFKSLYRERVVVFSGILLISAVFFDFFDLNDEIDYIQWLVRNLILIVLFFYFSIRL